MSKPILFFGNERLATGVTTDAPALTSMPGSSGYVRGGIVAYADEVKIAALVARGEGLLAVFERSATPPSASCPPPSA